jgi:hypothetical protein
MEMMHKAWKCDQCQHIWLAGRVQPQHCAKCKSRKWNASGDVDELNAVIEKHDLKPASVVPRKKKAAVEVVPEPETKKADESVSVDPNYCPHHFKNREFCIMFNGGTLCRK